MPDTLEITSDYSGSLSPTSSEEEEEPEEQTKIMYVDYCYFVDQILCDMSLCLIIMCGYDSVQLALPS